jgi:hypothetical protein
MNTMAMREEKNIIRNDMIHLLMLAKKGSLKNEDTQQLQDDGFAAVKEQLVESKTKKIG